MDPKSLGIGLIALIIGGGGLLLITSLTTESLKTDLRRKQAEVTSLRQSIESAEQMNLQNEVQSNLLRDQFRSVDELEQQVAQASAALDLAKNQWERVSHQMDLAIKQVRQAFRKQTVPKLPQAIGEPLLDCHFVAFTEDLVTVEHSTGISKFTANKLPPNIAARLRLGYKPTLRLAEASPRNPELGDPISTPAFKPLLPSYRPEPTEMAPRGPNRQAVATLMQNIATYKAQITSLETIKAGHLADAQNYESKPRSQISSGQAHAERAYRSAQLTDEKILATQAQIEKLQAEIAQLYEKAQNRPPGN